MNSGIEANGLAIDCDGGFVVANNSGIWCWDGADRVSLIADTVSGSRCRMNDCIADPQGRLLAGSWFYSPAGGYELGKLVRVDTDGAAHIVDEGFHLANGLAFSPDARTLYLTDSAARSIYAYNYEPESGKVNNRRVVVRVPDEEGIPDGLTVDGEGFLWSAQWYGASVVRYDPEGKAERRIQIPALQISSVMFGGPDLTDLFITSAAQWEETPLVPRGFKQTLENKGGQLYGVKLNISGRQEYQTRLTRKFLQAL